MDAPARLRERLRHGPPLLLDGSTGTELERRGFDTTGPTWSARVLLERPEALRALHEEYATAGADVVTAATFRTNPSAFRAAGLDEGAWRRAVQTAVDLPRAALKGAGRADGWVAGSLAPIGDCYSPAQVPASDEAILAEHRAHARALRESGVDLLLLETMNTVREAGLALRAAQETGLPVLVSFVVRSGGHILSAEPLDEAVVALGPMQPEALLVNCCTVAAAEDAAQVLEGAALPWGASANAADEDPRPGFLPHGQVSPSAYAAAAVGWLRRGAALVGSCCGTGPAHTAALRAALDALSHTARR